MDQTPTTSQKPLPAQQAAPVSSEPVPAVQQDYAYYQSVFKGQNMPFAYLDLDLLSENIRLVVARVRGKRVRIASKSIRSVAVLQRILASNDCFQGVMCFTAREAVYLAGLGFNDLLIGYPCWHAEDIAAVARATTEGAQITLMVDSLEHIAQVETVAVQHGVRLPVCLEIDLSLPLPGLHFGVWRSTLREPEQIRPLVERIKASDGAWLDGIMGYEAQVAGVGDNYARKLPKNTLVRWLKARSVRESAQRRARIVETIESLGVPLRFVNGGGTGSIATTRDEQVVTEITVGSGFYAPTLFDLYRDFRYQPAAGYAIEIVRRPAPSIYTCLGGGYVASGMPGPDRSPQPYLPHGARLDPLEAAGEVQTPIHYKGRQALNLGDPIFMRHAKAGELCERFTHLLLVSQDAITDQVTTYRGDGQCFL